MPSTINAYYEYAKLSMASYTNFSTYLPVDVSNALYSGGAGDFPLDLAKDFAGVTNSSTGYTVLSQRTDANGFSATLFKNNATGEKILAIRGTNDLFDGLTDVVNIALLGTTSLQPQYASLKSYYQQLLTEGKLGAAETFSVAGHSLGGFLAQSFAIDYAGQVTQTYTYNAPGIGGVVADVLSAVGVTAANISVSTITNIVAQPGLSATAGLGTLLGNVQNVFIENQSPNLIANHYLKHLTDALAIYGLFAKVDPAVSVGTITNILSASTSTAGNSLESALAALGKIYGKSYPTAETTRDILYSNLYDLQAAVATGTVVSLANASRDTLVTGANTDIAYRYVLKELNPFAVVGADYSQYNSELALYNPNDGSGTLTDLYLADRAAFLTWRNKINAGDLSGDVAPNYKDGSWYFEDKQRDIKAWVGNPISVTTDPLLRKVLFANTGGDTLTGGDHGDHLYGGAGNDVLTAGAGEDYLEGQLGDDNLKGEDGRDILLGGQGNDTLDGGKGADRLEGGKGTDVYVLSSSAPANDVIRDMDGLGSIQLDGTPLDGGRWKAAGQWQDDARGITYSFNPDNSGRGNLVITCGAGIITVENFAVGELGLNLPGAPAALPSSPADQVMQGDLAPIDFDPNTAGVQIHLDQLGNVIVDPGVAEDNRVDTLYDGTGNDKLLGVGGNDILHADRGGNDTIDGGVGDDLVTAGPGDDLVVGFQGNDLIFGGWGDDRVYALSESTVDAALVAGESGVGSQQRGEWLDGGVGADTLVGDWGNDALLGGKDNDLLIGGNGDDFLMGDETSDTWSDWGVMSVSPDWSITRDVVVGSTFTEYRRIYSQASVWVEPDGGADLLYGGSGDDWMFGNQGNDVLDGGTGQDVLFGQEGNDLLFGQDGNDVMSGDSAGNDIPGSLHGADYLDGGKGDDELIGNGGDDVLVGGDGNDSLSGDGGTTTGDFHGADKLNGGAGADSLWGDGGNDELFGGDNNDHLEGDYATLEGQYHGDDYIDGEAGDDGMAGEGGKDTLIGGDGNDTMSGDLSSLDGQYHDADYLDGGIGDDFLWGDGGADTLLGGDGADELVGDAGADYSLAPQYQGADYLDGGGGADGLWGGGGNDALYGGSGDDYAEGNEGDDAIDGGDGADTLWGNDGNDTLVGAAGNDYLGGGAGDDVYEFELGSGLDTVEDDSGADRLRFGAGIQASGLSVGWFWDLGTQYLSIGYGGGDSVAIKGGLLGSIEAFEFAGGAQLTLPELLQYAQPLYVEGTSQGETIYGGGANDNLLGLAGDDVLRGGGGDDGLYGDVGNDILVGGLGRDYLAGDAGSDSYRFTRGDGDDVIYERVSITAAGDVDTLTFDASVAPQDVTVTRNSSDLLLTVNNGGGSVRVQGYFSDPYAIEKIQFSGGTTWDNAYIRAQAAQASNLDDSLYGDGANNAINGLGGNDLIDGGGGNDTLLGGEGIDTLYGGSGDDDLDGGGGNDTLYGGTGSDSYRFGTGSGNDVVWEFESELPGDVDTIRVGSGVRPEDVIAARGWFNYRPDDLVLYIGTIGLGGTIQSSGNSLTVRGYFSRQDSLYKVEQVVFDGGTVWDYAAIRAMVDRVTEGKDTLYGYDWNDTLDALGGDDYIDAWGGNDQVSGSAGNDFIMGNTGNDTLFGGTGSDTLDGGDGNDELEGGPGKDTLTGGAGNDVYVFGRGDGIDRVTNYDIGSGKINSIRLKADVAPNAVSLYRHGNDLVLVVDNSPYDQMWVGNAFDASGGYAIDQIVFGDTTVWNQTDIYARAVSGALDTLVGTAGNDVFMVDHPSDVVTEAAGQGNDTVQSWVAYTLPNNVENLMLTGILNINGFGNTLNNIIQGNAADNLIKGNGGYDTLYGGAGNDTLSSEGGSADMYGGPGDDLYDFYGGSASEVQGEGVDTVVSHQYSITLGPNIENVTLAPGAYAIYVTGNELDNVMIGNDWTNYIDGGLGADTMISAASPGASDNSDIFTVDNPGDVVVDYNDQGAAVATIDGYRNHWRDQVRSYIDYVLPSNIEELALVGTAAISGAGNGGNNVLDGSINSAANVLAGGGGNDFYIVDSADLVQENPDGGTSDTIQIAFGPVATYGLPANVENLMLSGWLGASNMIGDAGNNMLLGNDYSNSILGGAGNDQLNGAGGYDTLDGGAGDDFLADGGGGADSMAGGAGNDTYVVDSTGDVVVEHADEGVDTVQSSIAIATLYANVENLTLTGLAAINGTGNELDNVLRGNDAANTLDGGVGNDTIYVGAGDTALGGIGNDTYVVDIAGGVVTEYVNEGTDTVQSSVTITSLSANVENLTLTGTAAVSGMGNELDNVLRGNSAANMLGGGGGNDIIYVDTGDTALGGLGDDTYVVDGTGGIGIEYANEGTDTVQSSVTITALYANVENLTLTGAAMIDGTGNELDNVLRGNGARNTLDGGVGNDTIHAGAGDTAHGGAGSDTLIAENVPVDFAALLWGNEGDDVLIGGTGPALLWGGLGNDTITAGSGGGAVWGDDFSGPGGNDLINGGAGTDWVFAGEGADLVYGNGGDDHLEGDGGNDLLDGGAGNDSLDGGLGDDTYVVDSTGDVVIEYANAGTDTIQSSVTITALYANVENLTLTGMAAINGTGNELDNVLRGNSATNALEGGGGNDTIYADVGDIARGGAGNDRLIAENAAGTWAYLWGNDGDDVLAGGAGTALLMGGVGNDTINAGTGGASIWGDDFSGPGGNDVINGNSGQDWIFAGEGADLLYGNGSNDYLEGDGGNDLLDGGMGNDSLDGGLGDDTYVVDSTGDVVTEYANAGTDTVQSSVTITSLSANVENLTLTGTSAISGADNNLDNLLLGNSGANTLTAGQGNDVLQGGAGDDFLNDSAGNNVLAGGVGVDVLAGGTGSELLIGGSGNDGLITGAGYDIIAFNRGDGADTVFGSTSQDNTISLGGGIRNTDLALRKSNNDLILDTGNGESVTLQNWYAATANKSVLTLQMIEEAAGDFAAGGADTLRDNKVEQFNFAGLVDAFDQARAGDPALTSWQLSNALLTFHLGGSDTAAIGGDLAYQYGKAGSLANIGLTAAQANLADSQFGQISQAINQPGLADGLVKLSA